MKALLGFIIFGSVVLSGFVALVQGGVLAMFVTISAVSTAITFVGLYITPWMGVWQLDERTRLVRKRVMVALVAISALLIVTYWYIN